MRYQLGRKRLAERATLATSRQRGPLCRVDARARRGRPTTIDGAEIDGSARPFVCLDGRIAFVAALMPSRWWLGSSVTMRRGGFDGALDVLVLRLIAWLAAHPRPRHIAVRVDHEDRAGGDGQAHVGQVLVDDVIRTNGLVLVIREEREGQVLLLFELGE